MLAVVGGALWFGGWLLATLVILVGVGLIWEYTRLVVRFTAAPDARAMWMVCGLVYIIAGCGALLALPSVLRILVIACVVAIDTGAYFAGRAFGERKIAPAISPSKTWAGLGGAVAGASLVLLLGWGMLSYAMAGLGGGARTPFAEIFWRPAYLLSAVVGGAVLAIVAQAGDFFESWMKRRAGVKDSSGLIPGHGGLFDRVDGLLPVAIMTCLGHAVVTAGSMG